jgi:ubiquinone/menaquinone biosynthesis C-methylase UbiE
MWKVLCSNFFQKFVPEEATVLEIAAGYCEFINNINARQKIAVDINEDTQKRANKDVKVLLTKSSDLSLIDSESIDIIFISNFFEHITKEEITKTVIECYRCLKLGGKLLVLQPNIRYIYKNYWMFYDHITPIDDRALRELLEIIGFKINLLLPKFLPYTTKSRFPKSLFLIKLYLKLPLLYKLFGGQAFVIAQK